MCRREFGGGGGAHGGRGFKRRWSTSPVHGRWGQPFIVRRRWGLCSWALLLLLPPWEGEGCRIGSGGGTPPPCQENDPADAHPQRAQVSAGVGKPPPGLGVCIWMHLVNDTGCSSSLGQPTPGVVKQDKSSGGFVDMITTRSDPQRGRMSSGERPIGAAKGKQPNTEALCQPPPPPASRAPSLCPATVPLHL